MTQEHVPRQQSPAQRVAPALVRQRLGALQQRVGQRGAGAVRAAVGVVPGARNASRRVGLDTSTDLDDVEHALERALAERNPREVLIQLEKATRALGRATRSGTVHPELEAAAQALQRTARGELLHRGVRAGALPRDAEGRRLQRVHDEAQLVLDRALVVKAKQEHLTEYQAAARGGGLSRLREASVFQDAKRGVDTSHLDAATRQAGLGDTFAGAFETWLTYQGKGGAELAGDQLLKLESMSKKGEFTALSHARAEDVGATHGLHRAETSAIRAYTAEDYQYANRAVANDTGWITGYASAQAPHLYKPDAELSAAQREKRDDVVDEHTERRIWQGARFDGWYRRKYGKDYVIPQMYAPGTSREDVAKDHLAKAREADVNDVRRAGAELTGVAVQGLQKLPLHKGTVYRKDRLNAQRFLKDFRVVGPDQVVARSGYISWPHLVSTSKSRKVAEGWPLGSDPYELVFELRLTDGGRDISQISYNTRELEVVLLPGTTFKVDSVTVTATGAKFSLGDPTDLRPTYDATVKAHQVAGGPRSGGTVADVAGPADPASPQAKARELIARAKDLEPLVTADVKTAARNQGGKVKGLEHRFKTEASLARKLEAKVTTAASGDARAQLLDREARKVNDALRYTIVLPFDHYRDGANETYNWFTKKGYKGMNFWDAWSQSTTYKGRNLTFGTRGLDGQPLQFELQLHTGETFRIKQSNHALYEEQRSAGTSDARRQEVTAAMEARYARVRVPAGIMNKT